MRFFRPCYKITSTHKRNQCVFIISQRKTICKESFATIKNIYKDFSSGGITIGFLGHNIWINKRTKLGAFVWRLFK